MKDNLKIGDTVRILKNEINDGNKEQFNNQWNDTKEIFGEIVAIDFSNHVPITYVLNINNKVKVRLYAKRFEKINSVNKQIKQYQHPLTSMFSLTKNQTNNKD